MPLQTSAYLHSAFSDLPALVDKLASQLEPHRNRFDAFVFRGMSGALVVPMLACKMGKPFILVRKPGDGSHSDYDVEGEKDIKTYLFVDDLIASGLTVREVQRKMHQRIPSAQCVGFALWFSDDLHWRGDDHWKFNDYFVWDEEEETAPPVSHLPAPTRCVVDEALRMTSEDWKKVENVLGRNSCTDMIIFKREPSAPQESVPNPNWADSPLPRIGSNCSLGEAIRALEAEAVAFPSKPANLGFLPAGVDLAACPGGGPEKQ